MSGRRLYTADECRGAADLTDDERQIVVAYCAHPRDMVLFVDDLVIIGRIDPEDDPLLVKTRHQALQEIARVGQG